MIFHVHLMCPRVALSCVISVCALCGYFFRNTVLSVLQSGHVNMVISLVMWSGISTMIYSACAIWRAILLVYFV